MADTRIERRLATSTAFDVIADVPRGVTFYVDTSVTPGVTYCYRVSAYASGATSTYSPEACGTVGVNTLRLSVTKAGDGAGAVRTNVAGIDCGAICSSSYPVGTPVTLVATPAIGSTFKGWTGGGCAGTTACTIAGNAPVAVTAMFTRVSPAEANAALTASWVDNSRGMADTRVERRLATSTAFGVIADVPRGVTSYVDTSVTRGVTYCYRVSAYASGATSTYSPEACGTVGVNTLRLSVTKAGDGAGAVRTNVAGIDCGAICSSSYPVGTPVTLVATPAIGSTFKGWTGGGCAGTTACTIAGSAPVAVTAMFTRVPLATTSGVTYTLRVVKSGQGTVTSSPTDVRCGSMCSRSYGAGTVVKLAATPDPGYRFAGWTGACTGTGACTVTMNKAVTVGAELVPDTPCGGISPYCE